MANQNKSIKITNRSDGIATYDLPEIPIRRVFNINESKTIPLRELNALFQTDGGAELIKHYLMVEDKEWVKETFDAPIEYFWGPDKIQKCLLEDDLEDFSETLDYAPRGVIDLIKLMAWKLPLKDLNKIDAIRNKLGFDVLAAVKIMADTTPKDNTQKKPRRRREEA